MSTSPSRPPLHPMMWVAAASVTALSLAGVAKLTGLLPDTSHAPVAAPETVASAPATPPTPITPPTAGAAQATEPTPVASPQPQVVEPAPVAKKTERHEAPHTASKPAPAKEHTKHQVAAATPATAGNPPPTDAVPAPPPAGASAGPAHKVIETPPPAICRECGVIENVEAIQQKGEGSGLGAVGGAILGGVLGNQVGEGSGKKLARIGGAVLGGFAGNEVERRARTISHYQVTVRMDDGTRRVITEQSAPSWHVGDAVRVRDGEIVGAGQASASGRSSDF
ncbi:glycine zipper 2TM domain-containing protein [Zoogloea sp. LCSB751]|uniref:glycine zipper 2TM domain-containing protein n=1 Tax=Zoogloea sp. LCSB751 TaxID=1965277 RepID=UPI0009A55868|nr:glycine zipper 2TM domain-containing protein [Zoogloea sp. LCSB751]